MMLFGGIVMTSFCTSFYLNQAADKSIRATLLSFKGLALNLGYGALGLLYAGLVHQLREDPTQLSSTSSLFKSAAQWFPIWFAVTVAFVACCQLKLKANPPK